MDDFSMASRFYTPPICAACGYQPIDRDDEITHYVDPTACDGEPPF